MTTLSTRSSIPSARSSSTTTGGATGKCAQNVVPTPGRETYLESPADLRHQPHDHGQPDSEAAPASVARQRAAPPEDALDALAVDTAARVTDLQREKARRAARLELDAPALGVLGGVRQQVVDYPVENQRVYFDVAWSLARRDQLDADVLSANESGDPTFKLARKLRHVECLGIGREQLAAVRRPHQLVDELLELLERGTVVSEQLAVQRLFRVQRVPDLPGQRNQGAGAGF